MKSPDHIFEENPLARRLRIRNVSEAKQMLGRVAAIGLGVAGFGLGAMIIEPGSLSDPVIVATNDATGEVVASFSEGDRLGSVFVVVGVGTAAMAGCALALTKREESIGEENQSRI